MQTMSRDDGFTIIELMISLLVTVMVMAGALTMVQNALRLNDSGLQLADANQNLRSGTNELIRDLLQAGRLIRVGGIPIPSGAGSMGINRPSPPGLFSTFDNVNQTTITAITTGYQLGPLVDNSSTDMITILMIDPILLPVTLPAGAGGIANDGASMTLGGASPWINGLQGADVVSPLKKGDLVWFNFGDGAIQTVTSVDATKAYFASGANDWFNFNQRAAADGSLMELCTTVGANPCNTGFPSMKVYRLFMVTYYVDTVTTPGTPRLTRMPNHFAPQALAGVVEDLDLTYDLVDGVTNPINVVSLPFVQNGLTYTATQIRKINLHIGVRSDVKSVWQRDYIRLHLNTAVDVRDLASVNRYQ